MVRYEQLNHRRQLGLGYVVYIQSRIANICTGWRGSIPSVHHGRHANRRNAVVQLQEKQPNTYVIKLKKKGDVPFMYFFNLHSEEPTIIKRKMETYMQ